MHQKALMPLYFSMIAALLDAGWLTALCRLAHADDDDAPPEGLARARACHARSRDDSQGDAAGMTDAPAQQRNAARARHARHFCQSFSPR